MDLEDPKLDLFEPVLLKLFRIAHTSGIWELERKSFKLEDITYSRTAHRTFLRGCHYGYDLAQRQVGALVIKIEGDIRERTQHLKDLRRAREKNLKEVLEEIRILKNRQIVLRRLIDSILFGIIRGETWLLRRFTVDLEIHNIDPIVLERTIKVAVSRNREDRLKFNLVSDLTTVVQIGDLIEIDLTSQGDRKWTVIELKEGRVNELLAGKLVETAEVPTRADIESIRESLGNSAPKQAQRMVRQQKRMRELKRVVETDRGIEPKLEGEFFMTPDAVALEDYQGAVEKVYELAKKCGTAATEVDGCIRILGFARERAKGNPRGIAQHQFLHMATPDLPCAFGVSPSAAARDEEIQQLKTVPYFVDLVDYNMTIPTAEPVFVWANRDMILDLVMGRIRMFVQFDVEAFFRFAAKQDIKMRWVTGREAIEIRKMSMRFPGSVDAWGIRAELPGGEVQTLLAGFTSRVFTNFARPRQLIDLIKRMPAQIAKIKIQEP
jgi:hypothetical protein